LFTQANSEVFQACITQLTNEQQQALHDVLSGVNWPSSSMPEPVLKTTSDKIHKIAGTVKTHKEWGPSC